MRIIRTLSRCPSDAKHAVVALGNFDGVHRGHQAILRSCTEEAKRLGVASAVMTFSPHPREFFAREPAPLRLQSFRQKMALFKAAGINYCFIVSFDARFAALSPQAFVQDVLAGQLQAKHVVTGYNFAFGKARGGDTAFLAEELARCGIGFTACMPVKGPAGEVVSSSAIRQLLVQGRLFEVDERLGHAYAIEGRVVHGDKRGGAIGYPTANIALGKLFRPRYGVYAVRLLCDDRHFEGVANLGIRPMFKLEEPLLEVHLFDASVMLYGKRVQVELVDFIREERYFDSLEALKVQIADDALVARKRLEDKA